MKTHHKMAIIFQDILQKNLTSVMFKKKVHDQHRSVLHDQYRDVALKLLQKL